MKKHLYNLVSKSLRATVEDWEVGKGILSFWERKICQILVNSQDLEVISLSMDGEDRVYILD